MVMSDHQDSVIGNSRAAAAAPVAVMRDYHKANWTVTETMVLIEAKKMDDERRMRIRATGSSPSTAGESSSGGAVSNKQSEPRWKWVEDYCWKRGCLRSQNQCNDKWDNLMRDYKKVRDYERRRRRSATATADSTKATEDLSYWKMDKTERKERNLPTNLIPQIYEALVEVVERKVGAAAGGRSVIVTGSGSVASSSHHHQTPPPPPPSAVPQGCISLQAATHPSNLLPSLPLQPPPQYVLAPMLPALPLQPSPIAEALPRPQPFTSPIERSETSDSETYEQSHSSPAKRRKRIAGGDYEGKRAAAPASSSGGRSYEVVGSAISRSASIIAEALQACHDREERRHRDLIGLKERRLKLEETNAETNRQGISGLVEAINKLTDSIHALAAASTGGSSKNQSPSSAS
ncbi:hypothetical protein SAY86_016419 [Trapa natans]|uniref:Myb-like domain-containing protein n=1 Tax=Trapa natans TaxID=22666 RepID=A0AAN7LLD4_TRANT|nr:hypothetical protein SAY86_016419 [Trapa natans]